MADALKTIIERSSIRAYKDEPLTMEEVDLLIKIGLLAPTAANRQEIFIVAVKTEASVVKEIQELLNPGAENTFYYDAPELFLLNIMHGEKSSCLNQALKVPEGYGFEVALAVGRPDTDKEPHEIDIKKNSVVIG